MPRSLRDLVPGDSGKLRVETIPEFDGNRIVHIGFGAFARAHIAVFTQMANVAANEGWRVTGVVRHNETLKNILTGQDNRYVVYELAELPQGRVIDCIDEVLSWRQDYVAVIRRLTEPETRVVTVTVTEKGYCLDHRGALNVDDELIKLDLQRSSTESSPANTLPGLLCQAAATRMRNGTSGFTVISCDNVSSNGTSLKAALLDFAAQVDPQLSEWIELHVDCPNTVVDCIVPKVTAEQVQLVQSKLDIDDEVPVLCEPFRQWVIASQQLQHTPRWEKVGVELVADIKPYEDQKLRILNAAHSALAYLGLLQGCRWVDDAMAQRNIKDEVNSLMEEVFPNFADQASARHYFSKVAQRFENPAMQHSLTQIGTDGSTKIPLRWAPSILANQEKDLSNSSFAKAIAAWLACWHLLPEEKIQGMTDPNQSTIKMLAQQLSRSRPDSKLWKVLLGIEPNTVLQQQIQAEFLTFIQQALDLS